MRKLLVAAVLTSAVAAGCQQHHDHKDAKAAEAKHDEGTKHEEISFDQLPAKVQAACLQKFPGATVKEVEKEIYADGQIHYEVELVDAAGKEQEVELDEDGEILPEH